MAQQWFIERNGHVWGPFAIEHLQAFISSGDLRPDEMVVPGGAQHEIAASSIPGLRLSPQDTDGPSAKVAPCSRDPGPVSAKKKWRLAVAGVGLMLVAIGIVRWISGHAEPEPQAFPHLPEWFQPAHRARHVEYPIPTGSVHVEGLGWVRPDEVPGPGNFTAAWLENNFTHYIDEGNAFYWAAPKVEYPSDGKLLAGTKVILGEHVNGMSLICTRTADGRLTNMFVEAHKLRDRSKGAPHADD